MRGVRWRGAPGGSGGLSVAGATGGLPRQCPSRLTHWRTSRQWYPARSRRYHPGTRTCDGTRHGALPYPLQPRTKCIYPPPTAKVKGGSGDNWAPRRVPLAACPPVSPSSPLGERDGVRGAPGPCIRERDRSRRRSDPHPPLSLEGRGTTPGGTGARGNQSSGMGPARASRSVRVEVSSLAMTAAFRSMRCRACSMKRRVTARRASSASAW